MREGQFNSPWGIAVDRVRGYIYVVDSANFRVQKFDMTGEFIMQWGSFGNNDGQFYFARGIAVDQMDGVGVCGRHGQPSYSKIRYQHERAASITHEVGRRHRSRPREQSAGPGSRAIAFAMGYHGR